MGASRLRTARRIALLVALSSAFLLSLPGCVFNKLRKDKHILESYAAVQGEVRVNDWEGLPIILAWGDFPETGNVLRVRTRTLRGPGSFELLLEPGRWVLGAFEDPNDNGRHDPGERGVLSEVFEIEAADTLRKVDLVISEVFERDQLADYVSLRVDTAYAKGDVLPLSDEKFSAEPARKGLWQPVTFALEARPGVYFLEPYDPQRTPVLFVHGMGGYGQQFETLIGRLDPERFQPWIFSYPSGYALGEVAEFLHQIVVELEIEHDLDRMCVVAHSMGGLVSRGFLDITSKILETSPCAPWSRSPRPSRDCPRPPLA